MVLPLILICLAMVFAGIFAYGTEPRWASMGPHGLDLILWTRRLEWPLVTLALLLCAGLIALIVAGKKRPWWLIGLLPISVLFYHRLTMGPATGYAAIRDPEFVPANQVSQVAPAELVVGLVAEGQAYAFPYAALQRSPVVVIAIRDKRMVLLWSEFANRAGAFMAAREVRAEDLDIVSMPDNALLIYNSRLGEFINGITGRTFRGEIPTGFKEPIPVVKTTLQSWVALHPDSKLMGPSTALANSITNAQLPRFALPGGDANDKSPRRVCVVACTQPIAVPSESITDRPLNLVSGHTAIMVVKIDGVVRAFNRELPGDLVPRFSNFTDPKHKNVVWTDSDTNSQWAINGSWIDGPKQLHGSAMTSIPVEDDLYWNVMKFWYPDLKLASDIEIAAAGVTPATRAVEKPPAGRRRKLVPHG